MSRQQAPDTLDLDGDVPVDDVEAAYREWVEGTHPDSKTDDEETFKCVNRVYECLTE